MKSRGKKVKEENTKSFKYLIWLWGFLIILALITLMPIVMANDIITANERCYIYDNKFCDVDNDCNINQVCITEFSPIEHKTLCSSSNFRINTIVKNECRRGFCADIKSTVISPGGDIFEKYEQLSTEYYHAVDCEREVSTDIVFIGQQQINITESANSTSDIIVMGQDFEHENLHLVNWIFGSLTTLLLLYSFWLTRKYLRLKKAGKKLKEGYDKRGTIIGLRYSPK